MEKLPYKNTVMEWKCGCGIINKSYSWEHHKLDMCKCGKSGIDLEEYLCRVLGSATIIKTYKGDKNEQR